MPAQMIVLVEDNPDDQTLTLRALKKQNIANEIVVLNDGVEALEYLLDPEKPLPHLLPCHYPKTRSYKRCCQ